MCATAEDELGTRLVRGTRHGTVQLNHLAATRDAGCHRGGDGDLLRAPGKTEDVVGCQAAHQEGRRRTPDAGERRRSSRRPDIDAVTGDHGFGQTEALLEFAL